VTFFPTFTYIPIYNRYIIYFPDNLERLANAQTFFMDGTFSVDPRPCKQLYTIRVPFKDVTVIAVYAFLPNKCQDTYRELFQSIDDNCPNQVLVKRQDFPSYHRTV
jgi:hypothetical protein